MNARATAALALLAPLFGCGETRFIDPDAAWKAELVFGDVEHLQISQDPRVYLHVRVRTRRWPDDLQLFAEGPWGRAQVPLDGAHRQACGQGETCVSIARPPGLPAPIEGVRLRVPSLVHEASGAVTPVELGDYSVSAIPLDRNVEVQVSVADPIRLHYGAAEPVERRVDGDWIREGSAQLFPRLFEAAPRPGACDEGAGALAWQRLETLPGRVGTQFDDAAVPVACLRVRPEQPAGGPAVASATLRARAVLTTYQHVYTPAEEVSPLVFVPIFDLEIPNETRCQEAQDLVRGVLIEGATQIASRASSPGEVLALPPEIITGEGPCRQSNDRTFSPFALAARVDAAIDDAFGPDRAARVVWVYANNLDLPLPNELVRDLRRLREQFVFADRRDFMLAIVPESLEGAVAAEERVDWLATEEPSFRRTISGVLSSIWPFRSVLHSVQTEVPLLPVEDVPEIAYYRVCSANRAVEPVQPLLPGLTVRATTPGTPAYRVALPERWLVRPVEYSLPAVVVEWQACEALCDQPVPGRQEQTPWWLLADCP